MKLIIKKVKTSTKNSSNDLIIVFLLEKCFVFDQNWVYSNSDYINITLKMKVTL